MGAFEMKVKILIKEKQQQVYQDLVRQLDAWENECIPKVRLSPVILLVSHRFSDSFWLSCRLTCHARASISPTFISTRKRDCLLL